LASRHLVRAPGKTGATPGEVRQALKDVGNSRKKVEEKLSKK
jgi:hypothetical protein